MSEVKRLVLDVLKPSEPSVIELAKKINQLKEIDVVDIDVKEMDRKVETVKLVVEGSGISYDKVNAILEKNGAVVHSIDRVTCGKRMPDRS